MTRPNRAPGQPDDQRLSDLLQGVLRQDAEAIDAWFRVEHPVVYRLCFGFLADAAEAEDVAQDAMLQLLDKLPTFDPKRAYPSWRDTLVLNRCRDRQRRNQARGHALRQAAERQGQTTAPDSQEDLEQAEVRQVMGESLRALSPREREVFVLRDLEGKSSAEVALLLSITQSSVRSLLTLARRRLRGILEQRLPGLVPEGGQRG